MPYFSTAQEWLTQSALLLEARPTTTRITTKYTIPHPSKTRARSKKKEQTQYDNKNLISEVTNTSETIVTTAPATLTLKTYDPVSGVTLKYKTCKAAEVGRLVQIMGRLGKGMAGLVMNDEGPVVTEVAEKKPSIVDTPAGGKKGKGQKKRR